MRSYRHIQQVKQDAGCDNKSNLGDVACSFLRPECTRLQVCMCVRFTQMVVYFDNSTVDGTVEAVVNSQCNEQCPLCPASTEEARYTGRSGSTVYQGVYAHI